MKKYIVLLISVLCIWLTLQFPHWMVNPGQLVQGHQDISSNCTKCHSPFWGIPNAKCVACHHIADIGKDTIVGKQSNSTSKKILFHEFLGDQECISCHTDHKGRVAAKGLSVFKHELLAVSAINACEKCHSKPEGSLHARLSTSCTNCHSTAGWKKDVVFNHEMIQGDKANCLECHAKPKDTFHAQMNDNCSKCHSTTKWKPATFEHSSFFDLDKDHNVECRVCHSTPDFGKYTCYGCHEHTPSKLANEHNEEGIVNLDNCVSCHKSANKHDIRGNGESGGESGGKSKGESEGDDD